MQALVGRAAELRQLDLVLGRLAHGTGGFLEVTGDPGFGKTRMLAEISARVRKRRMITLAARAGTGPSSGPFQLFAGALDDHLTRQKDQHDLPGDLLEQLAFVRPAVRPWGSTLWAAPAGGQADAIRALRRLLGLLSADGLVLTLDDVHLADAASLAAVEYLVRNPVQAPLLVAVAYRPRQAALRLRSVLAEGAERGYVHKLMMEPLSRQAAAELLGPAMPGHRLRSLHRDSGGNPRYLLMLARQDEQARLESLLLAELDGLAASELTVAAAAAVLGEQFSFDGLAAVCDLDEIEVKAGLDALMHRDLIRPATPGPLLSFRDRLIWKAAYAIAHPVWRVEAHRRALRWVTGNGGAAIHRARHAARSATAWSPEVHAVLKEAAQACLHSCPDDALDWLQLLLDLLPSTEDHDARRADVTYLLATALGLVGRFEHSRDLLHGLLVGAQAGRVHTRQAAVALCARMERMLGRHVEAVALLRRETGQLAGDGAVPAADLCVEAAAAATMTRDRHGVLTYAESAVSSARSGGNETALARALAMLALAEASDVGRVDRGRAGEVAAIVDAMSDHDLLGGGEILSRLGWAELIVEDVSAAERHLRRGEVIARRAGHRAVLAMLTLGLSRVHLLCGPLDAAARWAEQAEHDAGEVGQQDLTVMAVALRAVALAGGQSQQDLPPAVGLVVSRLRDLDSWVAQETISALASAARALGSDGGGTLLPPLAADVPDPAQLPLAVRARHLEWRTCAALAAGDLPGAQAHLAAAELSAAASGLTGQRACWLRAQAAVLSARYDEEGAASALSVASSCFAEAGLHIDHAQTDLALAIALSRCQRVSAAIQAADRAVATAARAGAHRLGACAGELRRTLRAQARRPADDVFAALTEREGEIARLVGGGGTSRQVAQQLHLSTRTVETHLARIYRKLDLSSRSALAVIVAREAYETTLLGG